MPPVTDVIDQFRIKAEAVSAIVARMPDTDRALGYAVDLCDQKEACQLLMAGCEAPLSTAANDLCELKQQKIIAAPMLAQEAHTALQDLCDPKDIRLLADGLRDHLAGIDIGLTFVDYGIAETGTLVIDSSSEDIRLTTMVSEVHVALLPVSRIRSSAFDIEKELVEVMKSAPRYLAFISGASRTADIERVLALGVHGPLELHILLLEDQ